MNFEQGYALLVGVGDYKEEYLNAPITARDAQALADALKEPSVGYLPGKVTILSGPQASRVNILNALKDLAGKTSSESTVVLLLAGHGIPASGGGYYFLSYDAKPDGNGSYYAGTVLSSDELVGAIKRIPSRKTLILFNTCFSGVVAGSLDAAPPSESLGEAPSNDVLDQVLGAGEGRVIISACRSNQKSWYGRQAANTIFIEAVLAGLRGSEWIANRNGYIGVFELYDYLYEKVREGALDLAGVAQEPVITIREGVGPFPVSLYRGGQNLGGGVHAAPDLNPQPTVKAEGAVRVVRQVPAGRDYNQAIGGAVVNTGRMGNVQTGGGTQWNIGSVSSGRDSYISSTVNQSQYGGVRFGDNANVSGTVVGGTASAPIFSGTAYGPVNQGSGNQTTAGRDVNQGGAELARVFAYAMQRVQAMPEEDREIATPIVKQAQAQAEKLQQGDTSPETESALERRLKQLVAMAPDIAEVVLTSLINPAAGVVAAIRKVAQRVKGS
ncbi:MAG TPA: caspase family protein, partial [Chloroflexia bacterium]|nr:caspase family protein [Chloroflexia bacterium]